MEIDGQEHSGGGAPAGSGIQPIARSKVSDAVAEQVAEMLVNGVYPVGSKLPPERVLVEEFGVGRTSIREALRSLEAQGLVEIKHGLGVVVLATEPASRRTFLDLDETTVPDLLDVRLLLESRGAFLAASNASSADIEAIDAIIDQMSQPGLSDEEYVDLDALFHRAIVHASGNALLENLFGSTQHLFREYSLRVIRKLPSRRAIAQDGHDAIVAAIRSREGGAAESAMNAHISTVMKQIEDYLGSPDVAPID